MTSNKPASIPFADAAERGVLSQQLPRPRMDAVVTARQQLSSARIRLTFSGDHVARFLRAEASQAPGAWIKLFVPSSNGDSVSRAYTLRKFDLVKGNFDVDFVIHDTGPVSAWAQAAQVGDAVAFAGPRDGGFALRPGSHWIVLIGDETALPAIQAISANLPADLPGIVLVEVDRLGEHEAFFVGRAIRLGWVLRMHGQAGANHALVEALDQCEILPGPGQAWVAGEAGSVVAVRTLLQQKWQMDRADISAKGYWKNGAPDFRH